MEQNRFSRIQGAVDADLLKQQHAVIVGIGGAYSLCEGLCRTNIGTITAIDPDTAGIENLPRQGYNPKQVGMKKTDALGEHLLNLNPELKYRGKSKSVTALTEAERDEIFTNADILLFMTDSFSAQAYGNLLALHYQKPAIWAGYYAKSRCFEIVFYIPKLTPACFRCCTSPRYEAQAQGAEGTVVAHGYNTIFHSQLLDATVGMLTMAILHRDRPGYEFSNWFGQKPFERNLLHFITHPEYGKEKGSFFQKIFEPTNGHCYVFNSVWQRIEREMPPNYQYCPDCFGGCLNDH